MPPRGCYPDKDPAIDRLMDTLSHHLRREVVHFFENHTANETVRLGTLVDHLAGRVPSATHEQLRTQLHHVHLPKLAGRDWLDYDPQIDYIVYRGHERAGDLLGEVADIF